MGSGSSSKCCKSATTVHMLAYIPSTACTMSLHVPFNPLGLQVEPPWLHFKPPSQLLYFALHFDADPDPTFHSVTDPDPNPRIMQIHADPDSGSATLVPTQVDPSIHGRDDIPLRCPAASFVNVRTPYHTTGCLQLYTFLYSLLYTVLCTGWSFSLVRRMMRRIRQNLKKRPTLTVT
jgi:hypothetical protein